MYIPDFIFWYIIVCDMALQSSLMMSVRPSVWQRQQEIIKNCISKENLYKSYAYRQSCINFKKFIQVFILPYKHINDIVLLINVYVSMSVRPSWKDKERERAKESANNKTFLYFF